MKKEEYNVEIPQDGETWEGMGALGTTPIANAENYRIKIVMTPEQQKYKEWLSGLAKEGKLDLRKGYDIDYKCLTANDGSAVMVAFGGGCIAAFSPSEWNEMLEYVYSLNPVYSIPPQEWRDKIMAIPYEDKDGWTCYRYELKEEGVI